MNEPLNPLVAEKHYCTTLNSCGHDVGTSCLLFIILCAVCRHINFLTAKVNGLYLGSIVVDAQFWLLPMAPVYFTLFQMLFPRLFDKFLICPLKNEQNKICVSIGLFQREPPVWKLSDWSRADSSQHDRWRRQDGSDLRRSERRRPTGSRRAVPTRRWFFTFNAFPLLHISRTLIETSSCGWLCVSHWSTFIIF